MSKLEDSIKKEEAFIHSKECSYSPLTFMLIPGTIACLDESIRSAGYLMIAGAVAPLVIECAASIYRKVKEYNKNLS